MLDLIALTIESLRTPAILFFLLGLVGGYMKSDLEFPDGLAKTLGLYLIMAVGLKGGVELSKQVLAPDLAYVFVAGVLLSFLIPLYVFPMVRLSNRDVDDSTAISISAHYGSVSLVTFVTAMGFLDELQISYAPYLVVLLTLMETPPILTAFFLKGRMQIAEGPSSYFAQARHLIFGGSTLLLIGSFLIGFVSGPDNFIQLYGFINVPFYGVLCIFLLELGLRAGAVLKQATDFNFRLLALGVILPLVNGIIGLLVGVLIGLSTGDLALFAILVGSASYIVVPAAMQVSLPQANHGLSITLALAITFPFNIIIGIPLFYQLAKFLS